MMKKKWFNHNNLLMNNYTAPRRRLSQSEWSERRKRVREMIINQKFPLPPYRNDILIIKCSTYCDVYY